MSSASRLLLVLLSAGLGILSFPPVHWHPLALAAPIPLLLALRGTTPSISLLLGLLYGLALYAGTLNWFFAVFGPMAAILFPILALFPALFAVGASSLQRLPLPPAFAAVGSAILWTGLEYFRGEWFTLRFPWITPGTALPPNFLTPVVGVYGISFLLVLGTGFVVFERGRRARLAGAILLLALAGACYSPTKPAPTGDIRIAAIQGEGIGFDRYLEISQEVEAPVDAFVWPEYALPYDVREKPEHLERLRALLGEKDAGFLVVGSRTELGNGDWANTAITVGPGSVLGTHRKNRPVHFFNDGVAGREAPAIPTPLGRIATPICFDNDYASVPRQAVANGAELLLVPSMDAAGWTQRQRLQHAELFRHRAAENARWIVVAASSGLTQVIDPHGRRVASIPLFEPGALVADVTTVSHRTIYNRFLWILGPACAVTSAILLVIAVIESRKTELGAKQKRRDFPSEAAP